MAVLDELVGARFAEDPGKRESFLSYVTTETRIEFRFMGSLGFGGKFRSNQSWRVDCYCEDETPQRKETIQKVNEILAVLYLEFLNSTPLRTFQFSSVKEFKSFVDYLAIAFENKNRTIAWMKEKVPHGIKTAQTFVLERPHTAGLVLEHCGGGLLQRDGEKFFIFSRTILEDLESIFQMYEAKELM